MNDGRVDQGALPTFLVVGAAKSGTTSLWHYLRSHPQVFMPETKEPGFFVQEIAWKRGRAWYEGLFAAGASAAARGEASATYTMFPVLAGVPERIASVVPDVRIIYLMRDPVERMRSGYVQRLGVGEERRPLRTALLFDATYVNLSRYAMQLEQYFDWFPRAQVLLLTAEELRDRRSETMDRVLSFIGVDAAPSVDLTTELNRGADKRAVRPVGPLAKVVPRAIRANPRIRPHLVRLSRHRLNTRAITTGELALDDDLRRRLADLVRPDVERLARWMDPSFTGWGLLE